MTLCGMGLVASVIHEVTDIDRRSPQQNSFALTFLQTQYGLLRQGLSKCESK
ncbi:hypothetical protein PILCRDRAFT_814321 [Piloderma croceum F 1598]|uniref:Uncharacterized protein n=1 Tax=Piloderma croceum (strain F 1598) TaxID=765440 RepID=A0A0C3FVF1_PILCF|nr:hypothetical protein PILCRDRAFT_814321 [Piloderma croceum F 1598]